MEIFDFSNAEYSNRNGSYGGAAGDKDGILINGEPWMAKCPKSNEEWQRVISFQNFRRYHFKRSFFKFIILFWSVQEKD